MGHEEHRCEEKSAQTGNACRGASEPLGRLALHSKHHANKEMLQHTGSPGEVGPSAPPLDSHLAQGREKHKSGRTSDLIQG